MVPVEQLIDKLKTYIISQLESMSKSNPMISFIKPFISRAFDKNLSKVTKVLDLISDDKGNVDIEGILSETIENLMNTNQFTFKTPYIGDIEIGDGSIKLNIPFTDKRLVFDATDLESFKEMLTTKN